MKKHQPTHTSHSVLSGLCSLTNQLRYGLVLLVFIVLLLVSGTLTYLSFKAQMQQVEVAQQEVSQATAAKINAYLDDLQRKLSYLARVQGLTDLSPEIQQKFLTALTRHHNAYETVAILDSQGKVTSIVSPYGQVNLNNIAQTPWSLYALKYQEDFVSPVEIDAVTKLPMVTLAVPIRNIQDEVNGVLIARINLKFLRFFIYQTHVGKTGYAYVIDNRNYLIAAKTEFLENFKFRDLSEQILILRLHKSNTDKCLAKYSGLKGVEVIGAIAPITSLRWQVVVELPTDEAYAPIRQMLIFMGASVFITTVVTVGVGIYLQRQIVLPLQRLTTAAARISQGDLDIQIKVFQRNEMGVLASTFNQMTLQLRELIQDLSQERNFVSAVLDTVGALVIVVNHQGEIVRFNRAFEQITQYNFAEVAGKIYWDIFAVTEELEIVKSDFQRLKKLQLPQTSERYLLTKDGTRRLIAWSTTTLLDYAGEISYVIGTGLDITERKIAEIELYQERDFNTTIVQTTPAYFVAINPDGTVRMMNQVMLDALGYNLEEVVGMSYLENFIPLEQQEMLAELFDSINTQKLLAIQENYVLTKNQNKLLVDWRGKSIFKENGELNFLFGLGIDITERRKAEIKLKIIAERERLIGEIALKILRSLNLEEILHTTVTEVRQFLQADRVFISNFNDNSNCRIFAESLETNRDSVVDFFYTKNNDIQELRNLFSQGDLQQIDDIRQAKISSKYVYYFEKYQVKSALAVPIMMGDKFFGMLVAHQCSSVRHWQQVEIDLLQQLATQVAIAIQQAKLFYKIQTLNVTLERKVEARTTQLQQKMLELQDLYKRQDEFLHAVSHDLRTPITGTLMLLKHWQQLPVENISLPRKILERMIESGERQLNLINSLLEAHISESKGITLNCEPIKIAELVTSIAEDLAPLLVKNQATLNNFIISNLPVVIGDPLQLRRVFENLISNALNHNPPGLKINLKASLEGEIISCLVEDNGIGMSEEQCKQIFERYARGDRARSTGIGLGLYLCRQIISAHGGEIGVKSSPGKGATFWFTLPCGEKT
ncbi:GAF sensor signal transduction histidine kinase [Calothrix brevissima NIES-22]|nr:GAF sensor signal transduction histidine kinase [Calothrix brevissima NIES-22]